MDFLFEPFSHAFMQRGLVIALLVGVVCSILSCYLILKGWSLMGDAISHAVFPGIVLASLIGISYVVGAFVAGLFCAVATGFIKEHSRLKEDTVMGVIFSGMFAFGLVLFTKVKTDQHLMHILFGNMLGVTWGDILETGAIVGAILIIIIVKWREFLVYCFDPNFAKVIGLPVRRIHFLLLILLSMSIVASLKVVGIILVIAMLIAPGAIAFLLTKRFEVMISIAMFVSVSSCLLGTFISFYLDAATGPTIIVLQALVFIVVFTHTILKNNTRSKHEIEAI